MLKQNAKMNVLLKGDYVRIIRVTTETKIRKAKLTGIGKLSKSYITGWSEEVYRVHRVVIPKEDHLRKEYYSIYQIDEKGNFAERLPGYYYRWQLQAVNFEDLIKTGSEKAPLLPREGREKPKAPTPNIIPEVAQSQPIQPIRRGERAKKPNTLLNDYVR